ncbi:conserved hypothetical protein [Vibrio chagasii]|nr:conserved hypothetical protein [Vibrio chagasii]
MTIKNIAALYDFKFKKGEKAIVFKLSDTNISPHQPELGNDILMAHTSVDVVAGGKVTFRTAYDGSIYSQACKVGKSLLHYYPTSNHDKSRSWADSSYDLGLWVYIPESMITAERDMAFWEQAAKDSFISLLNERYGNNNGETSEYIKTVSEKIQAHSSVEMTAEEWNEKRLATLPKSYIELYSSH